MILSSYTALIYSFFYNGHNDFIGFQWNHRIEYICSDDADFFFTMCHSPLKLVLRMYFSSVLPSADSICGQTPGWSGHKSLCMLWRAWAMAYTASITNCTFPSCSYLESIPMRSWPEGRKARGGLPAKCTINCWRLQPLRTAYHLQL